MKAKTAKQHIQSDTSQDIEIDEIRRGLSELRVELRFFFVGWSVSARQYVNDCTEKIDSLEREINGLKSDLSK